MDGLEEQDHRKALSGPGSETLTQVVGRWPDLSGPVDATFWNDQTVGKTSDAWVAQFRVMASFKRQS
ncbi:MAG: hypothetical protein AMXMBFR64_61770 [Myxococcales bacterium]